VTFSGGTSFSLKVVDAGYKVPFETSTGLKRLLRSSFHYGAKWLAFQLKDLASEEKVA
jgi:hypothetical protein